MSTRYDGPTDRQRAAQLALRDLSSATLGSRVYVKIDWTQLRNGGLLGVDQYGTVYRIEGERERRKRFRVWVYRQAFSVYGHYGFFSVDVRARSDLHVQRLLASWYGAYLGHLAVIRGDD